MFRRVLSPVFSGNLESYDLNKVAENEIVRKGRRLSQVVKMPNVS